MSQLFDEAWSRVVSLPATEQDAIATMILEALEDEACWDAAFLRSPSALESLAQEAQAEYAAGETMPLDPDLS